MGLLSDESSDVSSVESDSPETDNDDESVADEPSLPPTKRQKLGDGSRASSSAHAEPEPEPEPDNDPSDDEQDHDDDLAGDISSDTSGDVPNSPINAKLDEEEFQEQVTVCAWDGCKAGDLGDMDRLVKHIRNDHIENRQKKYTCEWRGCPRMSMPHASGYALKAHMRSHTREKPFHCYLPECDRAFTRSDALAKHMRTVHETEALRPSDPIPKSMQSQSGSKGKQLKIVLKQPNQPSAQEDTDDDDEASQDPDSDFFTKISVSQGFTAEEAALDVESLWKVMVAHVKWGLEDRENMIKECKRLQDAYREAWLEKEVLLDQVLKVEEDWWQRRQVVLAAEAQVRSDLAAKEALAKQSVEDDQASGDEEPRQAKDKREGEDADEADEAAEEGEEGDDNDEGDDAMEE